MIPHNPRFMFLAIASYLYITDPAAQFAKNLEIYIYFFFSIAFE